MITQRVLRARTTRIIPSPRIRATRFISSDPRRANTLKTGSSSSPSSSSAAKIQTFRRVIITGAVALITAVGAITGARLKSDSEAAQQAEKIQETSLDERIEMLEDRRAQLVTAKIPVERKLADLQARMAEKRRNREAEMESKGRE
ncbi:hypothetical protein BD289DRAFT_261935 [Coniella lustricola]|uniref:Uncharacterized protein n=1 Tax=Coniella lustricola TaxID=2025994 RepID=A0A2T3A7V2_9PEZI|nr:hypothetical protein BD289DRAFT_261935 [Coniella lustricola]